MQIQQDGSKLSGTFQDSSGSSRLTGSIARNSVSFSVQVQGRPMTLAFTGTIDGDKMSGTFQPQGGGGGGLVVQGLPLLKPPYGLLNAIDLDKGELKWQVPHGDTPDAVRNSPVLAGKTIPKTGQPGSVGLVVTKSLVVLGDPSITTTPDHPRGAMFRAYDKTNGKEVGAVWMPAPQSGSPMTYMANGRQYFIVAVSGGNYSGEYIAFALPQSEVRPTTQASAQR